MSMVRCQCGCYCLIDSDEDPDCFVEAGPVTKILCEAGRERYEDECRAGDEVDGMNEALWADGRGK